MKVVIFNEEGFALQVQQLPPTARIVSDDLLVQEPGQRLMLVSGEPALVWDWRGFPCYGGESGRVGSRVPDDPALIGKDWAALAAFRSDGHPHGLLQEPRPESAAEKKAREKAEAEARAAAEVAATRKLVATSVQFAQACALAGIITKDEALNWAAAGVLPEGLAGAIDAIPDEAARFAAKIKAAGALHYERASPMVAALGAAIGKSEAELDALFKLAVTL